MLSFAGTGIFVYLAARRLAPTWRCAAYVLIAWNPLFIFESAANAHNDSLMLLFTAAAIYCAVRRDWTLALPALTAAILIKFTTGLLALLYRLGVAHGRRTSKTPGGSRSALGLAALLAVAGYLPFWEGPATFRAVTSASANALNSPGWLLREALERTIATEDTARRVVSSLLALVFGAGYLAALRLVWNGRAGTHHGSGASSRSPPTCSPCPGGSGRGISPGCCRSPRCSHSGPPPSWALSGRSPPSPPTSRLRSDPTSGVSRPTIACRSPSL